MIKLSKDNLFLWNRLVPGFICVMHLPIGVFFAYVAYDTGLYFMFLFYLFFFFGHFLHIKIQHFFQAKDVYYLPDTKQILARDDDGEVTYGIDQIESVNNRMGFVRVKLEGDQTLYFFTNSAENLEVLYYVA